MKEETLSDKIEEWINPWDDKESAIATRHVKIAIQKLKENLKRCGWMTWQIDEIIEKIFGDALTGAPAHLHSPLSKEKSGVVTPEDTPDETSPDEKLLSGTSDKIDKWIETLRDKGQNALRQELHDYLDKTTDNPKGCKNPHVSDCCKAEMEGDHSGEGTFTMVCKKCKKDCNPILKEETTDNPKGCTNCGHPDKFHLFDVGENAFTYCSHPCKCMKFITPNPDCKNPSRPDKNRRLCTISHCCTKSL